MGFRFRKSLRILPGLRLNITRRGVSANIGVRGANVHVGSQGAYVNVGLPGTGVSYRERLSTSETPSEANTGAASSSGGFFRILILAAMVVILILGMTLIAIVLLPGSK